MSKEQGVRSLVRGGKNQLGGNTNYQALATLINSQNNSATFIINIDYM